MPSKAQEEFVSTFRLNQVKFSRLYSNALDERGLTLPQYTLLSALLQCGSLSMSETGKKLQISKPAVTYLSDQLESKKCILRIPDPSDRRVIHLKLLEKGQKKALETQAVILKYLLKALGQFSEAEQSTISLFYKALGDIADESLSIQGQQRAAN